MCMRRKKMYEAQQGKLMQMINNMDQQLGTLDGMSINIEMAKAMISTNEALKAQAKDMYVDFSLQHYSFIEISLFKFSNQTHTHTLTHTHSILTSLFCSSGTLTSWRRS